MNGFTNNPTPFGLVLDFETTGVDPFNDRIVTAFVGIMDTDGEIIQSKDYVVNSGVQIPEGAIAIHGISNEYAQANGQHPAAAVGDILSLIQLECVGHGLPLIGANVSYDITMLLHEARRHLSVESSRAAGDMLHSINVLDTYVLDKALDKYRRGSRKLIDTAAHYGVQLSEEEAHGAQADAIAAGRIALAIMGRFPQVSTLTSPPNVNLAALHEWQQVQKVDQAAGLQAWLRQSKNDPSIHVSGDWPIQLEPAA